VESDSGKVQGLFIQTQGGANGKCGTPVAPGASSPLQLPGSGKQK
jgi:lipopolysaccharide export system protein LptA